MVAMEQELEYSTTHKYKVRQGSHVDELAKTINIARREWSDCDNSSSDVSVTADDEFIVVLWTESQKRVPAPPRPRPSDFTPGSKWDIDLYGPVIITGREGDNRLTFTKISQRDGEEYDDWCSVSWAQLNSTRIEE